MLPKYSWILNKITYLYHLNSPNMNMCTYKTGNDIVKHRKKSLTYIITLLFVYETIKASL